MRRKRKEVEAALGKGARPNYLSGTQLVFDKKERAIVQAFLASGRGGPLGRLGQGLLDDGGGGGEVGDDGALSTAGSFASDGSRTWSRWGNSSHGSTAVVVNDLVKLTKRAERVCGRRSAPPGGGPWLSRKGPGT